MAYSSKTPKFTTMMLVDQATTAGTNPPSGSHRILDRNGVPFTRDSSGAEIQFGGLHAAKSATYTITDTDSVNFIAMTTSSTNRTVNLPAASTNKHRIICVKKVDSGTGSVTIDGNASETIDGALTQVLTVQYSELVLQCDGSNWHILAGTPLPFYRKTALTSTFGGPGTTGNVAMILERFGNVVHLWVPCANFTATSTVNTSYTSNTNISSLNNPSEFYPTVRARGFPRVVDNGGGLVPLGMLEVSTVGVIKLYATTGAGAFTASGTAALADDFVLTYTVN
jgi:hypothetical protein